MKRHARKQTPRQCAATVCTNPGRSYQEPTRPGIVYLVCNAHLAELRQHGAILEVVK